MLKYHIFHFDRATIDDLVSEGNYMVSLDISVCYDAHSPCKYTETILRNTRLRKSVCDWETWYIDDGKLYRYNSTSLKF